MLNDLEERVDSGLEPLRAGLVADGSGLEVKASSETDVEVSLVITPETCQECIVAPDLIETMIKTMVGQVAPEANVTFIDPRTSEG